MKWIYLVKSQQFNPENYQAEGITMNEASFKTSKEAEAYCKRWKTKDVAYWWIAVSLRSMGTPKRAKK